MDIKKMDIVPPQPPLPPTSSSVQTKNKEPKTSPRPKKKNKKLIIFISCFLFLGIFITGGYFFLKKEINTPLNYKNTEEKIIKFEPGESVTQIAKKLKKASIIKSDFYFLLYVFKNGLVSELQAGRYSLSPSMTIPQIVQKMVNGETTPDEVKVTIPEGFRLSQIEERVNKEFKTKNNEIKISNFKVKDFKDYFDFLADAPDDADLEGYLFPDTYFFPNKENMTANQKSEEIVKKMLKNFQEQFDSELQQEVKNQNKTIFEIVTMASILEKEVKTKEDMEIVSGIFWKRIQRGIPLQADSTLAYILGEDKIQYSLEDTKTNSPYNTYLNKGLPKGPISSPGLEAIEAAIYPQNTDYNFFLTDPKTGNTIFAKTLEEHNQNKVKYLNQ